ncbi:outer membrane beta-barrel protein [Dyadobacter crusticola]|uniref:outer membrane beta-barrel protein n=1 Tax=Dyadobacter crusticola TaxID=292407 RepID=UPI0004E1FE64|nr:outer membrane beta-barrel protein [Dyadobacter crusticola]
MIYKITLFAFLLITFHYAKAQKSFEPGYLLVFANDTLNGYVDYKNWSRNPETISFRSAPGDAAKTYGLDEIEGFYVHGERYIKAEVDVNTSPSTIDELSHSPLPKLEKRTAFLMFINSGPKSLYYLKGRDDRVQLYISDKPGVYELLVDHRYLASNASKQVVTVNQYRDQLKKFFSDCEGVMTDKRKIFYSSKAISQLFDRYYAQCASTKPAVSYKSPTSVSQFGVVAGLSGSRLSFEGVYDPRLVNGNFPVSYHATGGLFLNLLVPRLKQRISIYNELAFVSYKTSIVDETRYAGENYNRWTSTMGYNYIKLANMVRYYIPAGGLKLFVNAGISNALAISETNEEIIESRFYNPQPVVSRNIVLGATRKHELGLVAGVGATYRKFGAEFRYESTNGMSSLLDLKSKVKRSYFLVSYRFK